MESDMRERKRQSCLCPRRRNLAESTAAAADSERDRKAERERYTYPTAQISKLYRISILSM